MTAAASTEIVPAIIYVDGAEFIRCEVGDDYRSLFDQTVKEVGGEVALMVWKPRWSGWLRERLSITTPLETAIAKAEGR